MLVVAIDLGTYSVKFLTSKVERKKTVHQSIREVVIDWEEFNIKDDFALWDLQLKIVREFLDEIGDEYRIILNAPSDLFTNRFTEVPVKNKKKAQMMIPFKLEEELPFTMSEAHLGMVLHPQKTQQKLL
jgi:general secretion pathway protein L